MLYKLFTSFIWRLAGTGISKLPLVMRVYGLLYKVLLPKKHIVRIQVQEHPMYVDLGDQGDVRRYLVSDGIYHPIMTKTFKEVVSKGMTVVDVGANIGYFTLIAAALVGKKGRVYAFEPEPHNFDLLLKNIALSGYDNIIPVRRAISDKDGFADFFIDRISFGSHSLVKWSSDSQSFSQGIIKVEVQTLDSYFKTYLDGIDLAKIDTEGSDLAVLKGMDNIISQNKDLIIMSEFMPHRLLECNATPEEYLDRLAGWDLHDMSEVEKAVNPTNKTILLNKYPKGKYTNLLIRRNRGSNE